MIENETLSTAVIYVADKCGVALNDMFTIFTQVQAGIAIVNMATVILAILGTVIFVWKIWSIVKAGKAGEKYFDSEPYAIVGVFGTILLPIAISWLVQTIGMAILTIMFPEYFAIESMLYKLMPSN